MGGSELVRLSFNSGIINKPEKGDNVPFAVGFKPVEATLDEMIVIIKSGYAISAQFKFDYRKTENFLCAGFIAVDIDSGLSLADALDDPFVKKYAAFIYTTPSHSEDANRFRIVFLTPHLIKSKDE